MPYMPESDSRHIVWKKSTQPNMIFQKQYEDEARISLIVVTVWNEGDDFSSEKHPISRKLWKEQSREILCREAKYERISCEWHHTSNHIEFLALLKQKKVEKSLICVFSQHISEMQIDDLRRIAKMNEMLWIVGYHPFELSPDGSELFREYVFDSRKMTAYQKARKKAENTLKKQLERLHIRPIVTDTTLPIDRTLYHFFKYHYEHK